MTDAILQAALAEVCTRNHLCFSHVILIKRLHDRDHAAICNIILCEPGDKYVAAAQHTMCNRAELMYGIMAVHEGLAYIGMVGGLHREISEVIHHTTGCIGLSRTT